MNNNKPLLTCITGLLLVGYEVMHEVNVHYLNKSDVF